MQTSARSPMQTSARLERQASRNKVMTIVSDKNEYVGGTSDVAETGKASFSPDKSEEATSIKI